MSARGSVSYVRIVDFDGTSIKAALLEAATLSPIQQSFRFSKLFACLVARKNAQKSRLTKAIGVDVASQTCDESLPTWLLADKAQGQCIVRAIAICRLLAEHVTCRQINC